MLYLISNTENQLYKKKLQRKTKLSINWGWKYIFLTKTVIEDQARTLFIDK